MNSIGVISNPTAGSGRGTPSASEALALLASRGHQVRDLSRGSWAGSLAHALDVRDELDALVVVGGDGMVHMGLQVCAESALPLGIVAAGSGNDVACSVGLPVHDIPAAIAAIERGLDVDGVHIDLGCIEGAGVTAHGGRRYFGAVLSAGIDAAIAEYANRMSFPRGPLKYTAATFRELPRFEPYGVSLDVDGEVWEQRCTLVAVANGPLFGGGLKISPESSHLDGQLDLVLAEPMSRLAIARVFPRLRKGTHLDDPRVRFVRASHVRIGPTGSDAGAPLPPAFADGELIGPAPFDVRVVPRALRVLGGRPDSLRV